MKMKSMEFENKYYQDEWEQTVPKTDRLYKLGTCASNADGSFGVYDGATNYMGTIKADGTMVYNGEPSAYEESFLKAAKEFLNK